MRPEPVFARDVVAWINAILAGRAAPDALRAALGRNAFLASTRVRMGDGSAQPLADWIASLAQLGAARARLDPSLPGCEIVTIAFADRALSFRQSWERIANARAAPWFDGWFIEEFAVDEPPAGPGVAEVSARLREALGDLVALGKRSDLAGWGDYFASALRLLDGTTDDAVHAARCTLPPGMPAEAHALAHAAEHSDAFGGMGSWNDFSLQDPGAESDREEASGRLAAAIDDALIAVAHAA